MVALRVLPAVPAELEHGHDDGQRQPAKQHHEHAANVLHAQGVGLRVLGLVLNKKVQQS